MAGIKQTDLLKKNLQRQKKFITDDLYRLFDFNQITQFFFSQLDSIELIEGKLLYFKHGNKLKTYETAFPESLKGLEKAYKSANQEMELKNDMYHTFSRCIQSNSVLEIFEHNVSEYDNFIKDRFEWWKLTHAIYIPISFQGKAPIGILLLFCQNGKINHQIIHQIQELVQIYYDLFEIALNIQEMTVNQDEVLRSKDKYQKILSLFSDINQLINPEKIYRIFLKQLLNLFGFDFGNILLEKNGQLIYAYNLGRNEECDQICVKLKNMLTNPEYIINIKPPLGPDAASGIAFANNVHFFFDDYRPLKQVPMKIKDKIAVNVMNTDLRSIMHMPIRENGQPVGIIQLFSIYDVVQINQSDIEIISTLCSFIPSILRNSELHSQLEEKNNIIKLSNYKIMQELQLASQIQRNLIPVVPSLPGVTLTAIYKPMEDLGGDFYDFVQMDNINRLGIFISDVSGHGVPAALITSMLKTLLDTAGDFRISPNALLSYINKRLYGQTNGNFLTAFYGVYDFQKKVLKFGRASHNFPFLIRGREIIELCSKGKILAVNPDYSFEEKEIQLLQHDKIIFYTDGLVETTNKAGDDFEPKLFSILNEQADLPIIPLIQTIYHELLSFREEFIFDDDVCIIGMEVL